MNNILYGDGIHDDYPAIQEMLDSGLSLVYLPVPKKHYSISSCLKLHSNQELRLDRYTLIRLLPNSNCTMIENADVENFNENITISGGIWDMNHSLQYPNPLHYPNPETGMVYRDWINHTNFDKSIRQRFGIYLGMCFVFNGIKGFTMKDLTIKNPVTFGADLAYVEDFTIENIQFDYTEGSPKLWNMDGVHVEGGCKNGVIRNLKGACHDDMVAITSDDFVHGPVENITVDGIYAQNSHSAVRLLSVKNILRNVHITNVYGTFYATTIVISKFFPGDTRSGFENITIDNIYASLCKGTKDVPGNRRPLIWIASDMDIKNLSVSHIHRNETVCTNPTIGIDPNTCISNLCVDCATQTNSLSNPMPFLVNQGRIENLYLSKIDAGDDEVLINEGIIDKIHSL